MDKETVLVFTRYGLGEAPEELRLKLAVKFLTLLKEGNRLPGKMLFYTEGVKLACEGSPVIELLQGIEAEGVELVLCSTCLDYFGLADKVRVGIAGGMPDIIEGMRLGGKVISV